MKYMIAINGPPGSGKGTIAQSLCEELQIPHISVGDMLREHIAKRDEIGMMAADIVAKGKFVPDEIAERFVKERLNEDDCKKGFVLDAFPRTHHEAKYLFKEFQIKALLLIELSDEKIIDRLSYRRVCPLCGHTYHLKNMPPKEEGLCDIDHMKLIHREDDKPNVIKERLELYHDEIKEIMPLFKEHNINIKEVSGELDIKTELPKVIKDIKNWYEGLN